MDKRLSDWAKENGIGYHKAWREFEKGTIEGAYKNNKGNVFVKAAVVQEDKNIQKAINFASPASVPFVKDDDRQLNRAIAAASSTRLNRSAFVPEFNRFNNIDLGYLPTVANSGDNITARDIIILAQKAYFNFPIVRNIVDMMTEFSSSKIYLTGGNKKSRDFFDSYFNAINLDSFQDKFFREYYRSGNVFIYPYNSTLTKADINSWVKQFEVSAAISNLSIPLKYIILNPADISVNSGSSFLTPMYFKILNSFEVAVLKSPKTESDKLIRESMPKTVQQQLDKGSRTQILMPLNPDNIYAVFYKKQDYEPLAIPMVYPVLDDLEWKSELKKIDKTISRTVQQAILLITVGFENKNGEYVVDPGMISKIQEIFKNESVGRVLVNDFTTKAEFIIPQIGDILDPKKYEIVNEDIRNGLNDILMGGTSGEKFANQSIKVKLFIGRLMQAREIFINDFLMPEIRRISDILGFKSYPTPKFEDIDLEDSVEWTRAVTRLGEIGFLTPEEVLNSIKTGRIPTGIESAESQKSFKDAKDAGLYQPIAGGQFDKLELAKEQGKMALQKTSISQPAGRPKGTKTPQSTKRIKPLKSKATFSAIKIKENIILADELKQRTEAKLLKKFKLKELKEEQKGIAGELVNVILANEEPSNWVSSIDEYIKNPVDKNKERVERLNDICIEHGVDEFVGGVLLASINGYKEEEKEIGNTEVIDNE